ncbi:unnamed protein product, partial [Allacma fusca]
MINGNFYGQIRQFDMLRLHH